MESHTESNSTNENNESNETSTPVTLSESESNQQKQTLSSEPIQLDDNLEEQEFGHQDDTVIEKEDDSSKYTKIDNLDEDPPIPGQKFACVSFISPEGLKNCSTRGLKIRGVYGSLDEARTACASLSKRDKYFDIFVCEIGKWCPWDPKPQQVEETIHKNKTQNKLMKGLQEKEMDNLNEIVGRKKEQLDNSKLSHKKRIAQSIKEGVKSLDEQKVDKQKQKELDKEREEKIARAQGRHNKENPATTKGRMSSRDRLGKMLEEKKKNGDVTKVTKNQEHPTESLELRQQKLQEEVTRVNKKEADLNELEKSASDVDDRLKTLQMFLKEKKQQREEKKLEQTK